ncbi:MAG TPA: succinate dehydrogenase/fumarate reductase iron-sulfur subunit [Methylomirabilota bacterium]|nr:succinate dehydrogenase/fumarate reductase iron-sulfur subunit [Methylomirabilota bacterium]HKE91488.1 succinate dehydrogenase/fumarate reductase iron-sulfur subunit [Gemmatimonadales bacterium]
MASSVTLRVFRWSPDEAERFAEYRVAAAADTTVLDALVEIQRAQDPTLAFRYACRVGMCGSCAMVVNGRERWACRTRLQSLGPGQVTVRPLYHFSLLRDLVVDMTPFAAKLRDVGAALTPRDGAESYALVSGLSAERYQIDLAIECIGCGMCVSACTMVGHNDRFPGPAALNRALTLELDHRDDGRQARWRVLLGDDALARCHGQGNCTEVCPMGLSPADSIRRLRRLAVSRLVGLSH